LVHPIILSTVTFKKWFVATLGSEAVGLRGFLKRRVTDMAA
jgi:hypothetical protein